MLYLARVDEPGRYRGQVIDVARSQFAPHDLHTQAYRAGGSTATNFRDAYLLVLRRLWREDRGIFVDLIHQAKLGDVTLLAQVLQTIAKRNARIAPVVDRRRLYANAADRALPPMAP